MDPKDRFIILDRAKYTFPKENILYSLSKNHKEPEVYMPLMVQFATEYFDVYPYFAIGFIAGKPTLIGMFHKITEEFRED